MISLGIIGCGQWGMNHVRIFSSIPEARVARCCDVRAERLAEVQQRYPTVHVSRQVDAVLSDPAISAVIIASPTETHYAVTKAALEQGKDVLCEKPLTTSAAQCEELIRLAEHHHRILMVGHVFVFNPAVRKLAEYVSSGALGRLYYLSARRTNLGPIRTDVDAVWDLVSHDLSIFDYLLGGKLPVRVSASGGAFLDAARADVAFISLEYPAHVVAHAHVSWLDPQKRRELTVVGSEKMAIFNDVALEAPLWLYDKGVAAAPPSYATYEQFRALPWERDSIVPHIPRAEPLLNEARHFLQCLEQRQPPQTDGHNALRVLRILESVSRSMAQDGTPIDVPRPATSEAT